MQLTNTADALEAWNDCAPAAVHVVDTSTTPNLCSLQSLADDHHAGFVLDVSGRHSKRMQLQGTHSCLRRTQHWPINAAGSINFKRYLSRHRQHMVSCTCTKEAMVDVWP
jgi:hypothetical protein